MCIQLGKIHFTLFVKFLFGLLFVMLPLYILNLQMNIWSQNDIKKEIIESSKSRVDFYITELENEFYNIIKLQSSLLNDTNIIQLSNTTTFNDDYLKYQAMNAIRIRLSILKDISSYIEEASVYIPNMVTKITSVKITDIIMDDEFYALDQSLITGDYPFCKWNDNVYINMSSDNVENPNNKLANVSFISIKLQMENIRDMVDKLSSQKNIGSMLIGNKHGLTIIRDSEKKIGSFMASYLNTKELAEKKAYLDNIYIGDNRYIVAYEKSRLLDTTFVIYNQEAQLLNVLGRHKLWMWIISILTIILIISFTLLIYGIMIKPLHKLINTFKQVKNGYPDIHVKYNNNDEFRFLYEQFNEMMKKHSLLINQIYEQEIRTRDAELKQLQYQINPHFLYNSILIICSLIKMSDYQCAIKFGQHLGNYYQYITRNESDDVPLKNEINHIMDYIKIQSIRFSNRFTVEFDEIPTGLENLLVPRLILQPVVENIFKYGLKNKVKDGQVRIGIESNEKFLHIFIEDNGEELTDEKLDELTGIATSSELTLKTTGLINICRRIRIKFGEQSSVLFRRSEMGGLNVEIRIEIKGG